MKEKALFIASNLFPVNSGATIYTYGNILRLADYFDIDLVSFVQIENPECDPFHEILIGKVNNFFPVNFKRKFLLQLFSGVKNGVFFQKYSKEFKDAIFSLINENQYKYIFFDGILTFHLIDDIKSKTEQSKVILIEHNIEFENLEEELHFSKKISDKLKNFILKTGIRKFEINSIQKSDSSLFISEEDLNKMRYILNTRDKNKLQVLPPFFPFEQIINSENLRKVKYRLLILGNMWWYPNIQGTKWFIEEVFPILIKKDPRYRLFVVGKGPSEEMKSMERDNIIFTGSVPTVNKYLKKSDFLVVPTFTGGGVKIKILEGIMKGIPVIARTENIVGYQKIFQENYYATDPEEFADLIIKNNNNPESKIEFITKGREKLLESADISNIIRSIR